MISRCLPCVFLLLFGSTALAQFMNSPGRVVLRGRRCLLDAKTSSTGKLFNQVVSCEAKSVSCRA
jgi:hypothetical protein